MLRARAIEVGDAVGCEEQLPGSDLRRGAVAGDTDDTWEGAIGYQSPADQVTGRGRWSSPATRAGARPGDRPDEEPEADDGPSSA